MAKFEDAIIRRFSTGSRVICNPPPTDTDNDTIVLVNGALDWQKLLEDEGWVRDGKDAYSGEEFVSYRKGDDNYICTESDWMFACYCIATVCAQEMNLLKKEDRIRVFETARYGHPLEDWGNISFTKEAPNILNELRGLAQAGRAIHIPNMQRLRFDLDELGLGGRHAPDRNG